MTAALLALSILLALGAAHDRSVGTAGLAVAFLALALEAR